MTDMQDRKRQDEMTPLMNNTKWEELRLWMYNLGELHPQWRTKVLSGYVSDWDGEWFYDFRQGGYTTIEWVELKVQSPEQDAAVLNILRHIYLPGQRVENGFRIYGYVPDGAPLGYI